MGRPVVPDLRAGEHRAAAGVLAEAALLAGAAALGFGTLPTSFGLPWWVGMLGATAVTVVGLRLLGQPVEDYRPD